MKKSTKFIKHNRIYFIKENHSQTGHEKVVLFPTIATVSESSKSDSGCSKYRPNARNYIKGVKYVINKKKNATTIIWQGFYEILP